MKKLMLLCLALGSMLFISCGDDDNPDNNIPDAENYFICKLNGVDFERTGLLAYAVEWETGSEYTIYGATLSDESQPTVYVNIPQNMPLGTHVFDNDVSYAYVASLDGSTLTYATVWGGAGEINLTSKTVNRLEGTFSFTAVNSDDSEDIYTVSEGRFSVEIR